MATEHGTDVRIGTGTDLHSVGGSRVRSTVRVLLYGFLWTVFTLGGLAAALLLAEFVSGIVGTVLLFTVGLGFVSAGPVVARRTMASLLSLAE